MNLEKKEKLEKYGKSHQLDSALIHHSKNNKQIEILASIQNDCKYIYRAQYILAKKEASHDIQREKDKVIKAINILKSYITTKHNDSVLMFLIETIDQRLDLNTRISASGFINKKEEEIMQELLSIGFSKTDIKKHLLPVLTAYIKEK